MPQQGTDPLADYKPDWKKQSGSTAVADPLGDYTPDWKKAAAPVAPVRPLTPPVAARGTKSRAFIAPEESRVPRETAQPAVTTPVVRTPTPGMPSTPVSPELARGFRAALAESGGRAAAPPTAAEATSVTNPRVPRPPSIGVAREPGLLARTSATALDMAKHPVRTASDIVTAPVNVAHDLLHGLKAELEAKNEEEMTAGEREALEAGFKGAAMLLGGPGEEAAGSMLAPAVGSRLAGAFARTGGGAFAGATFTPRDPMQGFLLGGATAGALNEISPYRPTVTRQVPQLEPDRLFPRPPQKATTATARPLLETEPPRAPAQAEPIETTLARAMAEREAARQPITDPARLLGKPAPAAPGAAPAPIATAVEPRPAFTPRAVETPPARPAAPAAAATEEAPTSAFTPKAVETASPSAPDVLAEYTPDWRAQTAKSPEKAIADAKTGEPFSATLVRGSGGTDPKYNEIATQLPILGTGRYTTPDKAHAAQFGPTITSHDVRLTNPLVISSDAQWNALTKQAGWPYPNPTGLDMMLQSKGQKPRVADDIAKLRAIVEKKGHDGIIVRVPPDETTGKTMQNVFYGSQVVEFKAPPSTIETNRPVEFEREESPAPVKSGLRNERGRLVSDKQLTAADDDAIVREYRESMDRWAPNVGAAGALEDSPAFMEAHEMGPGMAEDRRGVWIEAGLEGKLQGTRFAENIAANQKKGLDRLEAELTRRGIPLDQAYRAGGTAAPEDEALFGQGGMRRAKKSAIAPPPSDEWESGAVIPGGPQGMTAALERAKTVLGDWREQAWARAGQPTKAYRESLALTQRGGAIGGAELGARQPDLAGEASPTMHERGQQDLFAGPAEMAEAKPADKQVTPKAEPEQGTLFGQGGIRRGTTSTAAPPEPPPSTKGTAGAAPGPKHPMPEPTGLKQQRFPIRPGEIARTVKSLLNPASLSAGAEATAGTIAEQWARRFRATRQAQETLAKGKDAIDKAPRARQIELWDAAEHGTATGDAAFDQFARLLHQVTQQRTDILVNELGRLKAESAIANYVGRFWSKPTSKKGFDFLNAIRSRVSLEGPKSFLKQRSLENFTDGLDAGLLPATYNYIEAQLAKLEEMDHLIAAQRALRAERERGRVVAVMDAQGYTPPLDEDGDAFKRIGQENDPAFTIYGPNTAVHREGFDAAVREGLTKALEELKIPHGRSVHPKMPSDWWGAASPIGYIETRFGGDATVIMHELGHILDFRHGLWEHLTGTDVKTGKQTAKVVDRKTVKNELRALADQRAENPDEIPKSRKAYLRNRHEQMANAIHALMYAPELMQKVAPTVKARLTEFLKAHKETAPLLDIKPSVRLGSADVVEKHPGVQILGHWYAPKGSASVWNAHLSRGLRGYALYDAWMAPVQASQQLMLGLSGFHATVIATEGMFSELAQAVDAALNKGGTTGDVVKHIVGAPAAAVKLATLGGRVMQEYLQPGSRPELATVLDGMMKGGFRGTAKSEFWTGERLDNFKRALRDALHAESKGRQLWGAARLPFDAIWAGLEMASSPLLAKYVPLMKTGATYAAVARELEKLPADATSDQVHAVMRDVTKEMDFRFGQVVYDNHFLNNTVKHLAQATFLAPGWTFGTIALGARGVADVAKLPGRAARRIAGAKPPRVGPEPRVNKEGEPIEEEGPDIPEPLVGRSAAYWIGAVLATLFINGLLTKLLTGDNPSGKDFWFFRDGTKDNEGNPNRHNIPGYLTHDVYSWSHAPVQTFENKLSPTLAFMYRLANNRDYFGNELYDPDASLPTEAKQVAGAYAKETGPLSIQNYREAQKRGQGAGQLLPNFFGVTPAKKVIQRTDAQNKIMEFLGGSAPRGASPEEAERRAATQQLGRDLRAGKKGAEAAIDSAVDAGTVTGRQAAGMARAAEQEPAALWLARFKRLNVAQAMTAFKKGTSEERTSWRDVMEGKLSKAGREAEIEKLP